MRGLKKVSVPGSKLRKAVLDVLQKEGFIQDYTVSKNKSFETLEINLKYMYGDPVINEIERVSRPGRRIYSKSDSIQKVQNGLGISIISTSKGIFSDNEAREKKLGGEVLILPSGVTVKVENNKVIIQGAKSKKELVVDQSILKVIVADNKVSLEPVDKKNANKVTWGLHRSLINNGIIGVSKGFEKDLKLTGVGFRATLQGKKIIFQLGFSHDVHYDIPEGIEVAIDKQTAIKVKGIDKELVGKVCADIKFLKPVEPYKGKGITSSDQFVLRKEGKKK
jgi:ribosomal protein L6